MNELVHKIRNTAEQVERETQDYSVSLERFYEDWADSWAIHCSKAFEQKLHGAIQVQSVLKRQYEEVLALNSILNRKLDESEREKDAYTEQLRLLHVERATITEDTDMDLLAQPAESSLLCMKEMEQASLGASPRCADIHVECAEPSLTSMTTFLPTLLCFLK